MSSVSALSARIGSALAAVGVLVAGCATTGTDWVREPEAGIYETADAVHDVSVSPGGFDLAPRAAEASAPTPRQRIRETVTLGETAAEAARAPQAAPATAAAAAPPVVVIQQYFDSGGAYYGSSPAVFVDDAPDRRFRARGARPRVQRSSATPGVGQSFPAPPSYGPSFPYKTAPASPWQEAR